MGYAGVEDQKKLGEELTTDLKNTGKTWGEMQKIAKDHNHWKSLITAFCATRREEVK